jgi:hypothetical protein
MKQIIILIAILTLLSCSKANDTKKEPEQIRYYKERMMRYNISDLGIVYIEPVEHKLRNRSLKRKWGKQW